MSKAAIRTVRCAIYTRVSTDSGLDQEFNSLEAQFEAASAYIKSQAHAGWSLIGSRYDDGGYSGGSTERPDLQKLLNDIRARKVDVIVVYKVDRLTRSLADFAKLVELFDAHGVSFVSVTQQFNTTTSMGRLTLNVLLSFAQFEREVTSERIRDKIAASKRKGLWVGGPLPLGYELRDGKITVIEAEAEQVRLIYRRYLELTGVNALVRDLQTMDVRTKARRLPNGTIRGGIPFGRGSLFYLLRNRFYIGEVKYRDEILPGEQPAIMDRALFETVQHKLSQQWTTRSRTRNPGDHLLTGVLFDDIGHRMVATHTTKQGIRYHYYVSRPHLAGESRTAGLGSVSRLPAASIEDIVTAALRKHVTASQSTIVPIDRSFILGHIGRIEVQADHLAVWFKHGGEDDAATRSDPPSLLIPWRKPPLRRGRKILVPDCMVREGVRPTKIERRARLVSAIARGRRWRDEIVSGVVTDAQEIAEREKCSLRHVNMTISLAFLAPGLVRAAVEGSLPRGIGVARLREPPPEWRQQFAALGLDPGQTT